MFFCGSPHGEKGEETKLTILILSVVMAFAAFLVYEIHKELFRQDVQEQKSSER